MTIAVILAGCGYLDGAEIQEAVCSLLALERHGFDIQAYAPDCEQFHVVDHATGEVTGESRNVLAESARIVRGKIKPLDTLDIASYDALWLPGGFGVAKNLCTFAVDGPDCQVHPQAGSVVRAFHAVGKPIVALCIAPALLAKVIEEEILITLGTDGGLAEAAGALGARHQDAEEAHIVTDPTNRIISTPCYLFDEATVGQIADSADKAAEALKKLLG